MDPSCAKLFTSFSVVPQPNPCGIDSRREVLEMNVLVVILYRTCASDMILNMTL